jgi:DNA topoisomerase I
MVEQLAAVGPAQSETEAKRNIVEAVKATARKLGNRPAACRNYYIHPVIFSSYADNTIFEVIKGAAAGGEAHHLRKEEIVVLRLIKGYVSGNGEVVSPRLQKAS